MNPEIPQSLVAALLGKSASTKGIFFVNGQDKRIHLTYSDLLLRARHRLAQFQALGLSPGSQLIIQTNNNALLLEGFWACLLGGIVAVPVSGGNSSEHRFKLFRIAEKLNNPGLYTDQQTLTRLHDFAQAQALDGQFDALSKRTIACDSEAPGDSVGSVHDVNEDDVAFIQFSSGSTSIPKGVVLTHKNLMTNIRSIIDGCQMDEHDHLLSWMPLTHDMGLIGFHLTPLVNDINHTLIPTDLFVRRPGLWLTESAQAGATILCSPNFGYQHVLKSFKPDKYDGLDLSSVRLLFNGAEPISVALCSRFMKAMTPFKLISDAMYPVYGLAEACLAVTFPSLDHRFSTLTVDRASMGIGERVKLLASDSSEALGVSFVAVGSPVRDVEIKISDNSGAALSNGACGHICIRGDNVTHGYYKEPELNAATIDADHWLDTGDLGFFHDQQLYITGRAKDIIFVSGQNVYPHDLEEIILQADLVERGKLAISSQRLDDSGEEQLIVFVQHRAEPEILQTLARSITRLLGEAAGVRVHAVVPVTRIPKTTSGKVQRYIMIEALQQGEYSPLLQLSGDVDAKIATDTITDDVDNSTVPAEADQNTTSRLLEICNEHVEGIQVGEGDNLFELGISSLTLAQIHASIEEVWPDQVDITDLFDYPTVSELAEFLDTKSAA